MRHLSRAAILAVAAPAALVGLAVPGTASAAPAPAPGSARVAMPVVGPGSEIGVVQERRADGRVRASDCTVGFVAERPDGRRVAVTAGHCGRRGQLVGAPTPGRAGALRQVGVVSQSSNPPENDFTSPDWAVVDLLPSVPTVSTRGPVRQSVVGDARVGDRVCQQGISSGWRCGVVRAVTPNRILTDIKSRPGDSGGPLMRLSDGAAVGIATEATDDRVPATRQATMYVSLRDVLARAGGGLRLATTNKGGVRVDPRRAVAAEEIAVFTSEPAVMRTAPTTVVN